MTMTFRTKLIPSLAAILLPFASLAPVSAQILEAPPSANTSVVIPPTQVVIRGRRHTLARHRTTKTAVATRPARIVFRGPLHTKKVAPITLVVPQVWVNIPTGVYHYPGSAAYGKTENGKYMTEAEAIKEHYRAAWNNQ